MSKIGRIKDSQTIVANETFREEFRERSSVKKLFSVNHSTKKAYRKIKQKKFRWANVPEKMD